MNEDSTVVRFPQPEVVDDPLTAVLRSGARRLLAQAIEAEAEAFLAEMAYRRLADGRARFVRHGHGPERAIQTGISPHMGFGLSTLSVEHGGNLLVLRWWPRGQGRSRVSGAARHP